jgi:hypothetical protein
VFDVRSIAVEEHLYLLSRLSIKRIAVCFVALFSEGFFRRARCCDSNHVGEASTLAEAYIFGAIYNPPNHS